MSLNQGFELQILGLFQEISRFLTQAHTVKVSGIGGRISVRIRNSRANGSSVVVAKFCTFYRSNSKSIKCKRLRH